MKKYDVTLTAHYEKTISVCAESAEQAKAKTEIILFDTTLSTLPMRILSAVKPKSTSLARTVLKIPTKKKRTRTNVVRTVRTSVPCAENVCVRTSAASNVLPSTEFGYPDSFWMPNSLVRGQPLIPRQKKGV